jgi:HEAT repeat protein
MFIEGVSKEPNSMVRAECAFGLGTIGVQTFRSLLLALHDSLQIVKDAASRAILDRMSIQSLMAHF